MEYNDTPRADVFTQGCRDFIRTFTYEDILACTVYAPPMLFMLGPAAIVAHDSLIILLIQTVAGFAGSWWLHRLGHRLLGGLPKEPQRIPLFRSLCLPVKLTLMQFVWMLEWIVAAAVFSGILGKRWVAVGTTPELVAGLGLFLIAFALFFVPVHLGRLWIERYYPAMPLAGPTDDTIARSFPGLRSLLR